MIVYIYTELYNLSFLEVKNFLINEQIEYLKANNEVDATGCIEKEIEILQFNGLNSSVLKNKDF